MGIIEKAEGVIGIGLIVGIGYIVMKNWQNLKDMWCSIPGVCDSTQEQQCPSGFHKEDQYPGMCIKDAIPVTYDEHGCRNDIQKYCDIQKRCLDNAIYNRVCVPEPILTPCPSGQHRNINLPGYPCHPIEDTQIPGLPNDCTGNPPWPGAHCCSDGSWRGSASPCPEDQISSTPQGCGAEIPVGSGCYPYATGLDPRDENGETCGKYCNTRCSDIYGNYKPCDPADWEPSYVEQLRCVPDENQSPGGFYYDPWGNLMHECKELCHRENESCISQWVPHWYDSSYKGRVL